MGDHDPPHRQAEAAFREALRTYRAHRSEEAQVRLERDPETLRQWQLAQDDLLLEVRAAARSYELARGTSQLERRDLGMRASKLAKRRWLIHALSGLVIAVASYPASISTAAILSVPLGFVMGLKVAPLLWVWFMLLVLIAEILLAGCLARGLWLKDAASNLAHGQALDEAQRREGRRLIILEPRLRMAETSGIAMKAVLALSLIALDFLANFHFLIHESEATVQVAFWLAFAGCLSFLAVAVLLGEIKYREDVLSYALRDGYPPESGLAPAGP